MATEIARPAGVPAWRHDPTYVAVVSLAVPIVAVTPALLPEPDPDARSLPPCRNGGA
jgi:hypothetical protein